MKAWRLWKVLWTITTNMFVITVAFMLFSHTSSDFERIVLCFVVLIYQSVNWTHTVQIRLAVEEALVLRSLILKLHQLAGEDTEEAYFVIEEAAKEYQSRNAQYYINLAGAVVVYLVVVSKLLSTLFL